MRGGGTPSAWHIKRAVPALGRVWLSGLSTKEGGTETEVVWLTVAGEWELVQSSFSGIFCTLNCEVGRSDGVVAGSGGRGPAEVDPTVLGTDIGDKQVSVAQDLGVVNVNGFAVGAAPGDDGRGIPRGQAFQHHSLVERSCDVLRTSDDSGPLAGFEARTFTRKTNR